MTIAVLNYRDGEIDIIYNAPEENTEEWLFENWNYSQDEVYWMGVSADMIPINHFNQ